MRELKFRLWKDGKMRYPGIQPEGMVMEIFFDGLPWDESRLGILMQYTGLKDKSGKEIYEGDVVAGYDNGRPIGTGIVKYGLFDSSHEGGCSQAHWHIGFWIEEEPGHQMRDMVAEDVDWKQVEVIGNIYEHKHLLGDINA